MVDLLILNYNDADSVLTLYNEVKNIKVVRYIVIVDNNSTDNSIKAFNSIIDKKNIVISSKKNGGYGSGNNIGIRYLAKEKKSKYILLCNPDVLISEMTIIELERFLENNPNYALAAPFMIDYEKQKQYNTAFKIPTLYEYILSLELCISKFFKPFYYKKILDVKSDCKDVGAVSGALFMFNVDKMVKYGMYDENIFLYCEEVVIGIKMKHAGLKIALLPHLYFIHNHSVSINKSFYSEYAKHKILIRSKLYVIKKYYHANLIEYFFAWFLSRVSLFEVFLLSILRGK